MRSVVLHNVKISEDSARKGNAESEQQGLKFQLSVSHWVEHGTEIVWVCVCWHLTVGKVIRIKMIRGKLCGIQNRGSLFEDLSVFIIFSFNM